MVTITEANATSTAPPSAYFARWADMATWPEWNTDTEWVRLAGPFVSGATGQLKPKGGPKVKFVVERVVPNEEFVDTSRLLGARLTFRHVVTANPDGGGAIAVSVTMTGVLRRIWMMVLAKGFRATAQQDLDRLVAVAESVS